MELQHIEIETAKEFDYEVSANYEHFIVKCFVDAETSNEPTQQTLEEIEVEGELSKRIVDNVSFWIVEVFDMANQKIKISIEEMNEAKNQIENTITNLIQGEL